MARSLRSGCTPAIHNRQLRSPSVSLPLQSLHGNYRRSLACCALNRAESDDSAAPDLLLASGCPVPTDQQPIQELKQLQEMFLFDWATMPLPTFIQKLATVWIGFFAALGMPVSAVTFDLHKELLQCVTAASAGSSFIVTVLVWRLYLGWQHVGDRLISATVEYEETGWYDGQVWVKTPQVLMRDRLMSNYTVKPALARLKRTLLGLGGALAASMVLLASIPPPAVNSATYYYDSNSASIKAISAPMSSSSGGGSDGSRDYYDTVSKYEPWAIDDIASVDSSDDAAPQFDMRSHMMLQ